MMTSLTQWTIPEWNFAQTIGMVAFFIGATAFLHSDGRRFRLHLMLFQMVLCSHFVMMGRWWQRLDAVLALYVVTRRLKHNQHL